MKFVRRHLAIIRMDCLPVLSAFLKRSVFRLQLVSCSTVEFISIRHPTFQLYVPTLASSLASGSCLSTSDEKSLSGFRTASPDMFACREAPTMLFRKYSRTFQNSRPNNR